MSKWLELASWLELGGAKECRVISELISTDSAVLQHPNLGPKPDTYNLQTRVSCINHKSFRYFDCPICEHTLHVTRDASDGGDVFTLRCHHCRWSSVECNLVASKAEDLFEAAAAMEAAPDADRAVQRLVTLVEEEAMRRSKSTRSDGGGIASSSSSGSSLYGSRSLYRSRSFLSAHARRASSRHSALIGASSSLLSHKRVSDGRKKWRLPEMHGHLAETALQMTAQQRQISQPDLVVDWHAAVLWSNQGKVAITRIGARTSLSASTLLDPLSITNAPTWASAEDATKEVSFMFENKKFD